MKEKMPQIDLKEAKTPLFNREMKVSKSLIRKILATKLATVGNLMIKKLIS